MMRWTAMLLASCVAVVVGACTHAPPAEGARVIGGERREFAAMVLRYPHDRHEFRELPQQLDSVAGAEAWLVRGADHITATFATSMAPGHAGKLLAVVINNPSACAVPTPATACGPHEEEFNVAADGGFYLGDGGVAGPDGAIRLTVRAMVGDTTNVLCGGAANPAFDGCRNGFTLRDPRGAEVTLVLLDNGLASEDTAVRARQLASPSPCPTCPPFTEQIAIGFGREPPGPSTARSEH